MTDVTDPHDLETRTILKLANLDRSFNLVDISRAVSYFKDPEAGEALANNNLIRLQEIFTLYKPEAYSMNELDLAKAMGEPQGLHESPHAEALRELAHRMAIELYGKHNPPTT